MYHTDISLFTLMMVNNEIYSVISKYVNKLVEKSEPTFKGFRYTSSTFTVRDDENWIQCENGDGDHAGKRFDGTKKVIKGEDSPSPEHSKLVIKLVESKHKVLCGTLPTITNNVSILRIFPLSKSFTNEFMDTLELGNIIIYKVFIILLLPPTPTK